MVVEKSEIKLDNRDIDDIKTHLNNSGINTSGLDSEQAKAAGVRESRMNQEGTRIEFDLFSVAGGTSLLELERFEQGWCVKIETTITGASGRDVVINNTLYDVESIETHQEIPDFRLLFFARQVGEKQPNYLMYERGNIQSFSS